MILSGLKIAEEVKNGDIEISPFSINMVNPNSYNYRISPKILVPKEEIIDPSVEQEYDEVIMGEEGYLLQPGKLYLGSTYESIGSSKYVTQLIGRSSVGRLGLFLQITAPLGHVGCGGHWTLELKCVQPLIIYPRMKIGQVTFWVIDGDTSINYRNGRYSNRQEALPSMFCKSNDFIR